MKIIYIIIIIIILFPPAVLAGPSSTNFELKQYSFGAGGADNSSSTNFNLNAIVGEVDVSQPTSANFKSGNGLTFTLLANVPPAPTFTNPSNFYNKLKIVINQGGNASDAKYAIAISTDNFSTDTKYVQNDNTVGATLGLEDWQTYTSWGGASGTNIIGLLPNTTYTVKIAAKKGKFSQTGYGPTAQVATIGSKFTFSLSTNSIGLGTLTPSSVTTSGTQESVTVDTNGTSGAIVYVYDNNQGLLSSQRSYTINSVTNNLAAISEGYGIRAVSTNQTSGGPMQAVSPYNGSGDNVGIVDVSKRSIFDSSSQPVTAGSANFELKAKITPTTPAGSDYADIITVIASSAF